MVPSVFLAYQQRWVADRSQVRIAEKSRRIGWSWASAAEVTLDAASVNGCDTWYVGYNKDMAQEYIRDCAFWARVYSEGAVEVKESIFEDDDPDKHILTYSITFATGWRITALSSRPTNLRGKRGHIVIDEAAFHDDLPGLIKAAMAVLMWGGKARVDIISTHNGTDNYFHTLIEECRAGKRTYSVHRCTLDDALADGLYKRICLVNGWEWSQERETKWRDQLFRDYGDAADEELLCIPARSGGVYLNRAVIERQMRPVPVVRLTLEDEFVTWKEAVRIGHVQQWLASEVLPLLAKLPKELSHFIGQDFGRVSDRSVIVPLTLAQDMVRKVPFVIELANVPFQQQEQIVCYIIDRLPKFMHGAFDATGNGSALAENVALRYNGADPDNLVIEEVQMTDKWYSEQLPKMKAGLDDKLFEVARDADHLIDLSALKVINGQPKLPKAKTESVAGGKPRHGDAAIAYALAYYASCLPIREYGYEAVGERDVNKKQERNMNLATGWRKKGGLL